MSSAPFDPYHKWLGIPKHKQPANYYRLLGLDEFEDDVQVVEAAADRQMAFLRKLQTGERAAAAKELLNEVSRARVCLLRPNYKAAYDDALRAQMEAIADHSPISPANSPEEAVANLTAVPPGGIAAAAPTEPEPTSEPDDDDSLDVLPDDMQLIVTLETGKILNWTLVAGQACLIGRGAVATRQIDDPYVSRTHCQIECRASRWVITDLDSSMGTYLNGKRIRRAVLQPGDQLVIGRTRMQLVSTEASLSLNISPQAAAPLTNKIRVDDFLGKTILHFCIERVIAQGVGSTVFLARHVERQRDVVVKILTPTAGMDDAWRRRFVTAVTTLQAIKHPNVVRLYAAGRIGPYCWLAMEYVPGENLKQMISNMRTTGLLDYPTAFSVALHIARSLEAAETHQVTHRNLTPKSILFRTADKVAKLADLMLAKTWDEGEETISSGADMAYLAPECVSGMTVVDHRADIYGWGATVYGLLTGEPPFAAETEEQLQLQIAINAPVPPRSIQPSIPAPMEAIILRALAKRPADRYQSANDLIQDLKRINRDASHPK